MREEEIFVWILIAIAFMIAWIISELKYKIKMEEEKWKKIKKKKKY